MDRQKIIKQLRAKADSTTFPEEAASLRAKADKLEAKYGQPKPPPFPGTWWSPNVNKVRQPNMQKVAEDFNRMRRHEPPAEPPMTMQDINDVMQSMHFGRPVNGVIYVNGKAITIDGFGPDVPDANGNIRFQRGGMTVNFTFGTEEDGPK